MKTDIKYLFLRLSLIVFAICLIAFFVAILLQKKAATDRIIVDKSRQLSVVGNAFVYFVPPDSIAKADALTIEKLVKQFRLKLKIASYFKFNVLRIEGTHTKIIFDERTPEASGKDFDLWKEMQEALQTNRQTFHLMHKGDQTLYFLIQPLQIKNTMTNRLVLISCDLNQFKQNNFKELRMHGLGLLSLWLLIELFLFIFLKPIDSALTYFRASFKRLREGKTILEPEKGLRYFHDEYELLKEASRQFVKVEEAQLDRSEEQKQIKEFLRIITAAAEGDFTVQANVTADALGALSDSFNLMINDLSDLIRDVKKAANQVAESTENILNKGFN